MKRTERDAFIATIAKELDTRDKRYMFLRMEFKEVLPRINLEGSPNMVAWAIYEEFKRQGMTGSLMACLNSKLDCNLYITYNNDEV